MDYNIQGFKKKRFQLNRSNVNARMQLSRIQSLRVAAVLEDFQNQLDLLATCFTLNLNKTLHNSQEKVTLYKLIQDCHALSELVVTFRVELEEKQTFNFLLKKIEDDDQRKQIMAEQISRVTNVEEQAFCSKLEEELKTKRALLEKLEDECAILEAQQEEQRENNEIIKHDKEDKIQMLQKEANDKREMLKLQIKLVEKQMEQERHTHDLSIKFLRKQQAEILQQRDLWEERTRRMNEEKTQEINDIQDKIVSTSERLTEMKRKYRVMEEVVKEDMKEQEELRRGHERIVAATTIQAFWRGCMLRRGVGGNKKTEKEKKGAKKNAAKGGKGGEKAKK
ncbi:dynein regulatory complex protein 9-like [Eucyclogobius newberryi]|uniref:dynein regulatory complex protein 9-like n=1 Tax=Eucyclogobius newberryi TaxID=166745 RepID=UPI003B58E0F4